MTAIDHLKALQSRYKAEGKLLESETIRRAIELLRRTMKQTQEPM